MRIGSTVLLYNGYCYNSYNWNFLRPLGKLNGILSKNTENLYDIKIKEQESNQSWWNWIFGG